MKKYLWRPKIPNLSQENFHFLRNFSNSDIWLIQVETNELCLWGLFWVHQIAHPNPDNSTYLWLFCWLNMKILKAIHFYTIHECLVLDTSSSFPVCIVWLWIPSFVHIGFWKSRKIFLIKWAGLGEKYQSWHFHIFHNI